jgi:methylated-DNA-[protein]-cysteine S-methyltransferase
MKYQSSILTPLGEMVVQAGQEGLYGLWFVGQKHEPKEIGELMDGSSNELVKELRKQLDAYFAGRLTTFDLPLAQQGTPFQMTVWKLLLAIPYGVTTSYGALAKGLAVERDGRTPSAQAVGGAVGRNPISIIIPCHRVIGTDGSLTGYAGGVERKAALLLLENESGRDL